MQKYIEVRSEKFPALGYGTFRLQGNDCITGVEDALKIGYRHIDTAQAYKNEEEVGTAIKNSSLGRDEIFLTTKVTTLNFSKENFMPSIEASLKKFKTGYVDLLLLHWPSDDEVNKIALQQLAISQSKGYAKLIGVSNFTMSQMDAAILQADICCNQVEYHPYFTQEKIRTYLNKHNLMLTAYRPLADGKILSEGLIISLAQKYNRTPAQIVLRWFLEQKDVSVIPKASDEKHRKDNFNIFDFELSEEDVQDISNLNTGTRLVNPSWSPKWDD